MVLLRDMMAFCCEDKYSACEFHVPFSKKYPVPPVIFRREFVRVEIVIAIPTAQIPVRIISTPSHRC